MEDRRHKYNATDQPERSDTIGMMGRGGGGGRGREEVGREESRGAERKEGLKKFKRLKRRMRRMSRAWTGLES
jgi:hypothetical protein